MLALRWFLVLRSVFFACDDTRCNLAALISTRYKACQPQHTTPESNVLNFTHVHDNNDKPRNGVKKNNEQIAMKLIIMYDHNDDEVSK